MLQILNNIWDFIQSFFGFVETVARFLLDTLVDLVYALQLCAKVISTIPLYFDALPSYITSLLLVIFSVVVIYKFIGREG